MMPKLYNKHHKDFPKDAVYIGRGSKWGNPFSHMSNTTAKFKVDTREQAVSAYEDWLTKHPELIRQAKKELRGKDLLCFCAPKLCHGNVLLRIANEPHTDGL